MIRESVVNIIIKDGENIMGKEQTVEGKRGRRKLKRIGKKVGNVVVIMQADRKSVV